MCTWTLLNNQNNLLLTMEKNKPFQVLPFKKISGFARAEKIRAKKTHNKKKRKSRREEIKDFDAICFEKVSQTNGEINSLTRGSQSALQAEKILRKRENVPSNALKDNAYPSCQPSYNPPQTTKSNESLRWEAVLSDSEEESNRINVYKQNRRKRYLAVANKKYSDWLKSCGGGTCNAHVVEGSSSGYSSASLPRLSSANSHGKALCALPTTRVYCS